MEKQAQTGRAHGFTGDAQTWCSRRVLLDDGILTWPNGIDLDGVAPQMEMKDGGLLRRGAAA